MASVLGTPNGEYIFLLCFTLNPASTASTARLSGRLARRNLGMAPCWVIKFETGSPYAAYGNPGRVVEPAVELISTAMDMDVELHQLGTYEFAAVVEDLPLYVIRVFSEALCYRLCQEAVAALHIPTKQGFIFGPAAEKWAPFDIKKFGKLPDEIG